MIKILKKPTPAQLALARINNGEVQFFTETMLRSLKRMFSNYKPFEVSSEGLTHTVGVDEALYYFHEVSVTVDPKLHEKGFNWMQKVKSKLIKASAETYLTGSQRKQAAEKIELACKGDIRKYAFSGFLDVTPPRALQLFPNSRQVIPIWKVETDAGEFEYAYGSWQGFGQILFDPERQ